MSPSPKSVQVRVGVSPSRRRFLQTSACAAAAGWLSFRDLVTLRAAEAAPKSRSMILLWMQGGPSQFETFNPKPDHENGGGTEVISTAIPGVQFAAGWEQTAKAAGDFAVLRSLTNKEGNHQRATYQLHTGYLPAGSVKHPAFGCNVAERLTSGPRVLPPVVTVGRTEGAGFLGVDYEPFVVDNPGVTPQNVNSRVPDSRLGRRLGLLGDIEQEFSQRGAVSAVKDHQRLYDKASKLVLNPDVEAFDITSEPEALKAKYGDNVFGRGCLLARRLVEQSVPFIEVQMRGWDTHDNNHERVSQNAKQVDPALAALVEDLKDRGLLEQTVVLWIGEFGRTPKMNPRGGRDHYPRAFNALIAGGGVRGGQVIGKTSADGSSVEDRPVTVADLFSSVCHALKIDPGHENISPLGRPMKIVDGGQVVSELFS